MSSEVYFLQALKIYEKVYGKESRNYALTLINIAVFYERINRNKEAKEYYIMAADLLKSLFGENDASYINTLFKIRQQTLKETNNL